MGKKKYILKYYYRGNLQTGFAWLTKGTNISLVYKKFGAFCKYPNIDSACINSGRLITQTVEFCTLVPNIFRLIISVFSLRTNMRISSHAPGSNSQITVIHRSLQNQVLRVQNLLHNILLMPRIRRWLLHVAKFADHLIITYQLSQSLTRTPPRQYKVRWSREMLSEVCRLDKNDNRSYAISSLLPQLF